MKQAKLLSPMIVFLVSLFLVSCDSMFSNNLFAKLTHPTPTVAEIASKTPAQMQDYISSAENLNQLADDPALKAAALANLAAVYGSVATTVDQQTAAVVAADISIKTVPDAASLSASVQAAIISGTKISSASPSDLASLIEAALPSDIKGSVVPGAAMPANFADMIDAYLQANAAYAALGAGVGADGGYAPGVGLSSGDKAEIAVNALISGLVSAVVPANGNQTTAEALWAALTGSTDSFSIPANTFDELTKTGPVANLVSASSLAPMLK
jgi:hypothetical protein